MQLIPSIIILTIVAISQVAAVDQPYSIDSSGIQQCWKTIELLRSGKDLTKDQWDPLFNSPGYAELERDQHRRTDYEILLRVAFQGPAEGELVNEDAARIVRHLKQASADRARIQQFIEKAASSDWVKQALDAAQQYLPAKLTEEAPAPPVKLVILYPGGRSCPDGVVFDAYFLSFASAPDKWLGHEFHHSFRRTLQCMDSATVKGDDAKLLAILERLELDGIADQIDKQTLIFGSDVDVQCEMQSPDLRSVRDQAKKVLSLFPRMIGRIDAALIEFHEHPADSKTIGVDLEKSLPWMAKQTTGMAMAMRIEEQFGRARLISTVGNPFAFLRAYQEAAILVNKPDECPKFSTQAMSAISDLEEKYARSPAAR